MIEGRCEARFAAKSFQRFRVLSHLFAQKLQRRKAAELHVLGLVNYIHPAELFKNAVVRNRLSGHRSAGSTDKPNDNKVRSGESQNLRAVFFCAAC